MELGGRVILIEYRMIMLIMFNAGFETTIASFYRNPECGNIWLSELDDCSD